MEEPATANSAYNVGKTGPLSPQIRIFHAVMTPVSANGQVWQKTLKITPRCIRLRGPWHLGHMV
jgi:hypothetical protein